MRVLRVLTAVTLVLPAFFSSVPAAAQTDCVTWGGAAYHEDPPLDTEWAEIALGVDRFSYKGNDYLMVNLGNEAAIYRIYGPTSLSQVSHSGWHPNPVDTNGSVFHALRSVALGPGSRYGLAAFRDLGVIVFDIGTGSNPVVGQPGTYTYYPAAGRYSPFGGISYRAPSGQEYIVSVDLEAAGTSANTTVYQVNGGTDLSQGKLTAVGVLRTAGGAVIIPRQSVVYGHYVYLTTSDMQPKIYIVDMSDPANPVATAWQTGINTAYPLALDAAQGYLIRGTNGTSPAIEIYDVQGNPGAPALLGTINSSHQINEVGIGGPYVYGASTIDGYIGLWDITDPTHPVQIQLSSDYWTDRTQPQNAAEGLTAINAVFNAAGDAMYLARTAELQMFELECTAVAPTANMSVSPEPAFPGDEITVTNTSTGPWTRAAIWITDQDGALVAGSENLSPNVSTLRYTIPLNLAAATSYTVHVAVENDEYPYYPSNPGDQLEERALTIDRTPEADFTIAPAAVITGDTVTLTATAEGHPSDMTGADAYSWTVTPPTGGDCGDAYPDCMASGSQISLPLGTSGTWGFELTVQYEHQNTTGGLYQTAATRQLDISSVAADFTIAPQNPINTQAIDLDGSSSRWQAGATPQIDWTITGPSAYTGCGSAITCQIPADTLSPGSYTVTLTLTNGSDVSEKTRTMTVADGTANVDFYWVPPSPEIGELVTFTLQGVPAPIDHAQWNFGATGCSGYSQVVTCTPDAYNNCTSQPFKYASGGSKNVQVTVWTTDGQSYTAGPKTVTVEDSGSCSGGGGCSYSVSPTTASYTSSGGNGTISVSTSSGCSWTASSTASWIAITSGSSGSGSGTVIYSVAANDTGTSRSGAINVAGRSVSITQTSGSTTLDFTWSPSSPQIGQTTVFTLHGLSGAVTQAVWDFGQPGCSGYAQQVTCIPDSYNDCTSQPFKFSQGGDTTVSVTVTVNGSAQSPITHTVTVQDSGSCGSGGCSYSISPYLQNFDAGGGTGSVTVTASGTNCSWTATANVGWIHVTSGSSGTGNGTVGYRVDANTTTDPRQGTISIAGRTFTVKQAAGGGGGGEETGPMLVPAAASVQGVAGTYWKSDLRVFNPTEQEIEIQIRYIPEPGDTTAYPTLLYTVDVGNTIWIDDIMYWFTQGAQAKGALVITYTPEDARPLIASRTYNQTDAGTYGQFVPVLGTSSLAVQGQRLVITGVEHDDNYRTNIGLINTGETDASVNVKLVAEGGQVVTEVLVTVPKDSYVQKALSNLVQDPELQFNGTVLVEVVAGGPVSAYGSVVDNLTGDPIFIESVKR